MMNTSTPPRRAPAPVSWNRSPLCGVRPGADAVAAAEPTGVERPRQYRDSGERRPGYDAAGGATQDHDTPAGRGRAVRDGTARLVALLPERVRRAGQQGDRP